MNTSNNKKSADSAKSSDKKTDTKETAAKSSNKSTEAKKESADTKKATASKK